MRICKCGNSFSVTFSPGRKQYIKISCSRKCANSRKLLFSEETKAKMSAGVKLWIKEHPEERAMNQQRAINSLKNTRRSSKSERALAEKLCPLGFDRGRVVRTDVRNFAVDLMSEDRKIWIESDGEWHFSQVHEGHDFSDSQLRDAVEEAEAMKQNVLLIRINNQKYSIDEQLQLIWDTISHWSGEVSIKKFY